MSAHAKLIAAAFPAFLKEDYPRAAEALAEYYEWECTHGAMSELLRHDARLDVDRDALTACLDEMGFSDIPEATRRSFVAWGREFMASRGSAASWEFLAAAFEGVAKTVDTAPYMLEASAARRIDGVVVIGVGPEVRGGRFTQAYARLDADIVESWGLPGGYTAWALAGVNAPVVAGAAMAGGHPVTLEAFNSVVVTGGRFFARGDVVTATTPAGDFPLVVAEVSGLPTGFTVTSPGLGYVVGDAVRIAGSRCRGEVAEVGANGEVLAARLLQAEGFEGVPAISVLSKSGHGCVLAVTGNPGRPVKLSGDLPYGGLTAVVASGGEGFAFTASGVMTTPFTVRTDSRGVIGEASVLTDSAVYSDGAYVVETQRGGAFWGRRSLVHPAGRHVARREVYAASMQSGRQVLTSSQPWAPLATAQHSGDEVSADLVVTPNFSAQPAGGETLSLSFVKTAFLSPSPEGGETLSVETLS